MTQTQISYSRVDSFKSCPFRYQLRYVEGIKIPPDNTNPANALIIGSALHKGIETDEQTAIRQYNDSFPIISDATENECIKLERLIPKAKEFVETNIAGVKQYEYTLSTPDFIGFIDLLVEFPNGTYGIYDFKYSNAVDRYLESPQIHIYKYYYELLNPSAKVTKLGYIMIPKSAPRVKFNKKTNTAESIIEFRKRLKNTLDESEIKLYEVDYDPNKVIQFMTDIKHVLEADEYPRCPVSERFCMFCDIAKYCHQGYTYMLPISQKRHIDTVKRYKVMFYGQPFTGKTTLANQFPDPIFLNTDGNINTFDSPYVQLKDVYEGPVRTKHAWEQFTSTIKALQNEKHSYKTVVVDLVDDTFEMCRSYELFKLKIDHESEDSFKAWDIISSKFLEAYKQLFNLDMNIVLLAHENTSRDLTRKSGDKVTAIGPNIREKIAIKLAGFLDVVARITKDETGHYILFKNNDIMFGGSRINITADRIPCDFKVFKELYNPNAGDQELKSQPKLV